MMLLSYFIGQKYFPVKYNLLKFFGYLGLAILIYLVSTIVIIEQPILRFMFHTLLLAVYGVVVLAIEKPTSNLWT